MPKKQAKNIVEVYITNEQADQLSAAEQIGQEKAVIASLAGVNADDIQRSAFYRGIIAGRADAEKFTGGASNLLKVELPGTLVEVKDEEDKPQHKVRVVDHVAAHAKDSDPAESARRKVEELEKALKAAKAEAARFNGKKEAPEA